MKEYQVELTASFRARAKTPEILREKIRKLIHNEGFLDTDFELTIKGAEGKPEPKPVTPTKPLPLPRKVVKPLGKSKSIPRLPMRRGT